jgi:hypothetical protein
MLTVSFLVSDKHLEETENVLLTEELRTFIKWRSIMHSKQNVGIYRQYKLRIIIYGRP